MKMKTNDIKKGTRVILRNGYQAVIEDNKKGNIRLATVEGVVTEMGSIYAHNIQAAIIGGKRIPVTLTRKQQQLRVKLIKQGF